MKSAATIAVILAVAGWLGPDEFNRWTAVSQSYTPIAGLILVAHDGGGLPAATSTNSREAFDSSYQHGFCLIETDFRFAGDDQLILDHEWGDAYDPLSQVGLAIFGRPTSTSFTAHAMRNGLTPQDLPALLHWMALHPSVSIVTDTKDDNLYFLRALAPHLDASMKARFIVQVYSPKEYPEARRLGFKKIIFTLYKIQITDADVIEFAHQAKLFGVTMPASRARTGLPRQLAAAGTRVFAHTVNGTDEATELADAGVVGLYTDYLTPVDPCPQSHINRTAAATDRPHRRDVE